MRVIRDHGHCLKMSLKDVFQRTSWQRKNRQATNEENHISTRNDEKTQKERNMKS